MAQQLKFIALYYYHARYQAIVAFNSLGCSMKGSFNYYIQVLQIYRRPRKYGLRKYIQAVIYVFRYQHISAFVYSYELKLVYVLLENATLKVSLNRFQ